MSRDRQTGGAGIATVASYFRIYNLTLGTIVLRDEFDRVNIDCNPSVVDGNSVTGQVLMSMWTLDIHGPAPWTGGTTQFRDSGLNRIHATGGEFSFSQIPASDLYEQVRSIVFRIT